MYIAVSLASLFPNVLEFPVLVCDWLVVFLYIDLCFKELLPPYHTCQIVYAWCNLFTRFEDIHFFMLWNCP